MNAEAVRKQKDKAAELVAKGKLAAALQVYRELVREVPSDLSQRQKVADLLNRTGNPGAAIAEYDAVATAYAERGELLKAISLSKVILQIDPLHRATEARLAELYSRQLGEGARFVISPPLLGKSPFVPVEPIPLDVPRAARPQQASDFEVAPAEPSPAPDIASAETAIKLLPKELTLARPTPRPTPRARPTIAPRRAPPTAAADPEEEVRTDRQLQQAGVMPRNPTLAMAAGADEGSGLHLEVMRDTEARQTSNFLASRGPGRGAAGPPPSPMAAPPREPEPTLVAAAELEHATIEGSIPIPAELPTGEEQALPKIPLFSEVPREAFMALVAGAVVRTASAGERMIIEGSPGDSLFAIVQGLVTLRKREGRRERLFGALGPGDFFGELSVVTEAPRLATVIAEDDTVLLEFPREQLQPILREHPAVRQQLEQLSRTRLFANMIRVTPLFDALGGEARARTQESLELRVVEPDEVVLEAGQPPDGLYVVLRGRLEAVDPLALPGETPLPEILEGDLFGVLSSLLGEPVTALVGARTPSVLVRIPLDVLTALLGRERVMRQVLAALARERWNLLLARRPPPIACPL